MTAPLAQRLRDAADTIEELNRGQGFPWPGLVSITPKSLRREAEALEEPNMEADT